MEEQMNQTELQQTAAEPAAQTVPQETDGKAASAEASVPLRGDHAASSQQDAGGQVDMARLRALEQRDIDAVFARNLQEIREAYPQERAQHIGDLGEDFLTIMASGRVSALAAYEAVLAEKNRRRKTPPSMGAVGALQRGERSYFTQEEVRAMSRQQVHENFEKIQHSMQYWK